MEIYLVKSTYPFGGSTIAGVFSTKGKAQDFINVQSKLCNEYSDDQDKTDFQSKLKFPKCQCEDMEILEYAMDNIDHYENNFKNLSMIKSAV